MFKRRQAETAVATAVAPKLPESIRGIRTLDDEVCGSAYRIEEFFDDATFATEKEIPQIQELVSENEIRTGLLEKAGLEAAARNARGLATFYKYCLEKRRDPRSVNFNDEFLVRDFGAHLNAEQHKILLRTFPVNYVWGFHDRYGDIETNHNRTAGRGNTTGWQITFGEEVVGYQVTSWSSFNFDTIPIGVAAKIVKLQKNPVVQSLSIMAPKEALTDPILTARCYGIGYRIIARWGKALEPIPGIDS